MKFLIFHNAADDSYMNTVENFRGAYANTETVDVYFKAAAVGDDGSASAGFDKIVLACTNGEEDRAVEELASAMTRNSSVITVADDVNSVYACQNITSVTSITMSATGTFKNLISWAADLALEPENSGSWIYAADATALDLRLPTVTGNAGVNYQIFIQKAQTGNTHILAEAGDFFEGALLISDADTATENLFFAVANTAEDDVINLDSDAKGRLAGGFIELVCDGTKWHVQGRLNGTGSLATPFHTAES